MFYYKLDLILPPSVAKVMENRNFKQIYFETMILCLQSYSKMRQICESMLFMFYLLAFSSRFSNLFAEHMFHSSFTQCYKNSIYSQTRVYDKLRTATTCLQRPKYFNPIINIDNIQKIPRALKYK